MQAGVSSVTENATSSENGDSTCPSSLRPATSAISLPSASKIVILNCASKAAIWPLTVTGLVTVSPAAGASTSATPAAAGPGFGTQTSSGPVAVGDCPPGKGETVDRGVTSAPLPSLSQAISNTATAQARPRSSKCLTYGETPADEQRLRLSAPSQLTDARRPCSPTPRPHGPSGRPRHHRAGPAHPRRDGRRGCARRRRLRPPAGRRPPGTPH